MTRILSGVSLCVLTALPVRSAPAVDQAEPLQCWWRTSASAVKVAEPFTLVLTCAVLDTGSGRAVVDRARLDPRAIELPPFEVLGGSVAPDTIAGDRVFFQHEYRLRLINDGYFNQDVPLPALSISYRLQTPGAGQDAATLGMERRLAMPHETVRITSLVPADAVDIRDAAPTTFGEIERVMSRGRLLTTTGSILAALGGLVALVGLVRTLGARISAVPSAASLIGDAAVLRGARREFAAVQHEREASGWTADLAARALAATRIVAEYALARTPSQRLPPSRALAVPGAILVRQGWPSRRAILVSGSVTPKIVARELAARVAADDSPSPHLGDLERALGDLTVAEYGGDRPAAETTLDASLASMDLLARRLAIQRTWPIGSIRLLAGRLVRGRDHS